MADRPYVLLSCAMSVDGYINDTTAVRLLLSGDEDLDRVDAVRADCDAILVGADTLRLDDPRLIVRSPARRDARVARGLSPEPMKVTISVSGELVPTSRFFTEGAGRKVVYVPEATAPKLRARLGDGAIVVALPETPGGRLDLTAVLRDLRGRGVARLLVEGGGTVHTQLLSAGLVDELHLVIAPFFVGDADAPRFVHPGVFPWGPGTPMHLAEARRVGDVALLRYLMSERAGG
jgi:5-amino-6-(5-phosphoribosylamino)uracil reductase